MPLRAHVVHHVRGRIRLKVPRAKGDAIPLHEVRAAISPMAGVRSVEANPATGSVIVNYDPELHQTFERQLQQHGAAGGGFSLEPPEITEVDVLARKIQAEAEFLSAHSTLARSVVEQLRSLDQMVKVATGNTVDLKVLLPLGLAVYSLLKVGVEASTPLWLSLGIFSFNSFVALHGHPDGTGLREGPAGNAPSPAGYQ